MCVYLLGKTERPQNEVIVVVVVVVAVAVAVAVVVAVAAAAAACAWFAHGTFAKKHINGPSNSFSRQYDQRGHGGDALLRAMLASEPLPL